MAQTPLIHSKKMRTIIILVFFLTASIVANAQQQRREILNELNTPSQRGGRVTVFEDESTRQVLGRPITPARQATIAPDGSAFYEMQGYRIQAFVSNDQRTARDQAQARRDAINNAFPEHQAEMYFTSPWWRVRAGNFETRDEAEEAMHQMRRILPAFGRELSIVRDNVRIPAGR